MRGEGATGAPDTGGAADLDVGRRVGDEPDMFVASPRFILLANIWICLVIAGFVAFRVLGSNTFRAMVAGLRQ